VKRQCQAFAASTPRDISPQLCGSLAWFSQLLRSVSRIRTSARPGSLSKPTPIPTSSLPRDVLRDDPRIPRGHVSKGPPRALASPPAGGTAGEREGERGREAVSSSRVIRTKRSSHKSPRLLTGICGFIRRGGTRSFFDAREKRTGRRRRLRPRRLRRRER
jgi:hypothetical protein